MATVIGTGISTKLNSFAAGKEAALSAYSQIEKKDPSIVITFISPIYDQREAIKGIKYITKDTPLIGCSSIGSISNYGSRADSIAVFIISSNSIAFSCGIGRNVSKSSRSAGHEAAKQASNSSHGIKQSYLMISSSTSGNSSDILRGSQEALGTVFPVIGGGSSGRSYVGKTYQYINSEIETDSVTGVLLSGDLKVGMGQASGWQPIGKPHKVTKAKYNIIKEIDKRIAVEIYEDYFEKSFEELKNKKIFDLGLSYPIGEHMADKTTDYITRVPLKIEDNGELVLNAGIEEEKDISLMIGDKDIVIESAKEAAAKAIDALRGAPIKFAIIFSDISRMLLLRRDAYKEIDAIKEAIGKKTPVIGCYTFGEYAPSISGDDRSQCLFNNHSVSITLFSE